MKHIKLWIVFISFWVILPITAAYGQSHLICKPPSYCYTHEMDSMAIEARLFLRQFEIVVTTYKEDSTSFVNQIKTDSTYIVVLETDNDNLTADRDKAVKRLNRSRKGFFTVVVVCIIESLILVLK